MSALKRSVEFGDGIWQWEWCDDKIAIAEWTKPPTSTTQWLKVSNGKRYYLEGTCNEDLRIVVDWKRNPDPPDADDR